MTETSSISPISLGSDEILTRLEDLHPKLIDMGLERTEALLEKLGNPHLKLPPVIHVAGTNGKGSAIAYLKAMLEAAGKSVHIYTSPHLVRFHERIALNGKPIDEAHLSDILARCELANDGAQITFFEITTVAAFLAFSETPADYVLLEVGLGGRYDSTNVIDTPAVSMITPIALDHQNFFGNDIENIAYEKTGILKRGGPGVVGPQTDDVHRFIEKNAAKQGAALSVNGQDWTTFEEHGRMVFQDDQGLLDLPMPRLVGRHQLANAGTAIAALRQIDPDFPETAIAKGLQNATWPARMQRLTKGPLLELLPENGELWLDGGHNAHAAAALAQALADMEERSPRPLHLICGMMSGKDPKTFLAPFAGLAKSVIGVSFAGENVHAADEIADAAAAFHITSAVAENVTDAFALLPTGDEPLRVLICGSLYMAGEVLRENG